MIVFFNGQPGLQAGLTGVLGIQFGANLAANAALAGGGGYSGPSFILRWQRRRQRR